MVIATISATLSSLKASVELARSAIALRDDAKLAEATQALNDRIIDVQNAALQLQEKQSAARDEIDSLKDEARELRARVAELEQREYCGRTTSFTSCAKDPSPSHLLDQRDKRPSPCTTFARLAWTTNRSSRYSRKNEAWEKFPLNARAAITPTGPAGDTKCRVSTAPPTSSDLLIHASPLLLVRPAYTFRPCIRRSTQGGRRSAGSEGCLPPPSPCGRLPRPVRALWRAA